MEQLFYFGLMSGMNTFYINNFPDYSHMQRTKTQFLLNNDIETQFHLPLLEQAFQEYNYMHQLIQQTHIPEEAKDTWTYIWGNTNYAATKFYHLPFQNVQPPKPFIWIWDSSCANKLRVFAWLLLMDILNVRNILRRKKASRQ
jgi:hypothetical protein